MPALFFIAVADRSTISIGKKKEEEKEERKLHDCTVPGANNEANISYVLAASSTSKRRWRASRTQ
jgi:hypothetical protein